MGVAVKPRGSLADVTDAELIAAYGELGSTTAVGKRFGAGHLAVWRRLTKLGAVTPRDKISEVPDAELIAAYEELKSLRKVARLFDVSQETIRGRLLAAGVKMPPRGRRPREWSAEDVEGLRATYAEVGSYSRTAEVTGVPRSTVYALIGPKQGSAEDA